MKFVLLVAVILCLILPIKSTLPFKSSQSKDEESATNFIAKVDKFSSKIKNKVAVAKWMYTSNITEPNLKHELAVSTAAVHKMKELWREIISYPWQNYKDENLKRKFKKYSLLGIAALSTKKYTELSKTISNMQSIYAKAKICSYFDRTKCDLSLEPELTKILEESRNSEELKHVWVEWRKSSGQKVKELYKQYVTLSNEAAVLNNFTDNADYWLDDFEDPDFINEIEALWEQIKPLYVQIHAYVRYQLRLKYGEYNVPFNGSIPAHLLGNMWSQSWGNIYEQTAPFPEVKGNDISEEMIKQGYTPLKMFQKAEDFFTSINLAPMTSEFWDKSIIEKPKDGRELVCHASAWDFFDKKDFRIKQCTRITFEDFTTVHHEMGHIQYFLQYKDQPEIYKEGANSGFHEAVGDVISLSVVTNKHLHKIGLLKDYKEDPKVDINNLYRVGLDKIVFLPFAYLMDLWRWDVFRGKISPDNYNYEWWKLRESYQGIQAPVTRSELDFDPGAKYHTVANVPYIRYFVSFVIQFQFHRSLCEKAGQYEPNNTEKALHKCDIYKSVEAGNALREMLQLGSSKPWHYAMEKLTGQRKMDASALLEYFKPLQEWLEKENKKTGEYIGWKSDLSKYHHELRY